MFLKKVEKRDPFTVEQCISCKKETKRKFKDGDYVFRETSMCSNCKGQLVIMKIFGELVKE
jgi:hypothetical protein